MQFQLIFDGDALSNHEINPRDLSIALIAIDELLKEANNVLNCGNVNAVVKVRGSFETGCFKINFIFSILDRLKDLLTSSNAEAIINAKDIIWLLFSGGGLTAFLKWLKGAKPEQIFENNDGTFTIYKDNRQIKIEKKVYNLYKNYKLRKSFENLVSPLIEREGIDELAVKYENKSEDFCVIKKEETPYFKCPEPEEQKIDEDVRFETNINIISLSFKEGNKWYVNDGQSSFYAIVEDNEFLSSINNNQISFAKGDILKVKIRRAQYYNLTENKLKTENYIEKVLSHTKPQVNMPLFA